MLSRSSARRAAEPRSATRRQSERRRRELTGWQIGSGFVTVGPHSEVKGQSTHPGRIIWNVETPDVQGEFERLVAAGATVVKEPYGFEAMPGQIATLSDPDGNLFQLMSPMGPEMGSGGV